MKHAFSEEKIEVLRLNQVMMKNNIDGQNFPLTQNEED